MTITCIIVCCSRVRTAGKNYAIKNKFPSLGIEPSLSDFYDAFLSTVGSPTTRLRRVVLYLSNVWHNFVEALIDECIFLLENVSIVVAKMLLSSTDYLLRLLWRPDSLKSSKYQMKRYATDSNCISLQGHRQQQTLVALSRPLLILHDSFSLPPAHTTHQHL